MRILTIIFAIVGALSVLSVFIGASLFFYGMNSSGEKINQASKKDALFILNWGGLDSSQNYKVLHSYQSPSHFLGDHLDYYCLQLEIFEPGERSTSDWVFGVEDSPLFNEARKLVASSGEVDKCFNAQITGIENNVAAYVWGMHINGRHITGAQIILYHQPTNRLLYVSLET